MNPRDEHLHPPYDDGHWSESYYFDYISEGSTGQFRWSARPHEDEVRIWLYIVQENRIHWLQEKLAPEEVHGTYVDGEDYDLHLTPTTPGAEWRLEFDGTVTVSKSA